MRSVGPYHTKFSTPESPLIIAFLELIIENRFFETDVIVNPNLSLSHPYNTTRTTNIAHDRQSVTSVTHTDGLLKEDAKGQDFNISIFVRTLQI